jgi:hypothetical protein
MANLFIGIGGSGVKTIANLKDQLKSSDPELFRKTRFLLIDTDEVELIKFEKHEKFELGDANVWQYFSQLQNQENLAVHEIRFLEWFDTKALNTMVNGPLKLGSSANRPLGRGAAAMKQIPFKEAINKILTEVISIANENNRNSAEESVKVYTCCSVAGGTGSSIYLDLMLILQNEFQEINITGGEIQLWSILYMPEIYRQMQNGGEHVPDYYKTNVFAFWKEIDAILKNYYKNVTFSEDRIGDYSNKYDQNVFKPFSVFVSTSDFRWKIFKSAILIDYMNSNDKTLKRDEMYSDTANLLKYLSDDKIGESLRSGWYNATNRLSAYSVSNNEAWIDSFTIAGFREFDNKINISIKDFVSETPYFFPSNCPLSHSESENVWFTNNQEDIDQIISEGFGQNIFRTTSVNKTILLKFKQGISFDDYPSFDSYKVTYDDKKKNHLDMFFPHIHKDFYLEDDLNVFFENSIRLQLHYKEKELVNLKEKSRELNTQIQILEQNIQVLNNKQLKK